MTPEQAAIDRIKAVASAGGDTLDLGDLPLISLPDEIFELRTLRILILGAGRYDAARDALMTRKEKAPVQRPLINLTGLDRLTRLRHLDLSRLSHVTAIPEVNALTFLTSLNLQGCTSLSSLPELKNLTQNSRRSISTAARASNRCRNSAICLNSRGSACKTSRARPTFLDWSTSLSLRRLI